MHLSKQHHASSSIALQRRKSFTFDVNQQAASLGQWQQQYDQHSAGIFSGYLDEIKFAGFHFFEEFTNQALQQQCCVKADNLWLGFSLQSQRLKINNQGVLAGQLMISPSEVEFELITPADFHIYGLVLNKEFMDNELFGTDTQDWANQSAYSQVSAPNHYVSYELAKLTSLLLSSYTTGCDQYGFLNNKLHRLTTLIPLITSKIADLLTQTTCGFQEKSVSYQTKRRVITKINNYIKQHNDSPLTVTKLCQISNVSRRTLQYCFQQGLGMSPMQYIRDCRLNEIRRILLKENNHIGISCLALNFGFFHLGTFNHQYKTLFGETPTKTLQRAGHYQQVILG